MAMLSHRHKWSALAVLFLPFILAIGNFSDLPSSSYHSSVSEVRISFFATDDHNRSVEQFNQEDFAVVDNGLVIRKFRSFSHSDETSLDLVAVVDMSESVAPHFMVGLRDVIQLVSQNSSVSADSISVVSFSGTQPAVICSGNCGGLAAERRLLGLRAEGATPLFDALSFGADFISHRRVPGVRPVFILFSDGDDTISRTSGAEALQAVITSDALIYSVDLGDPRNPSQGRAVLQRLAQATGGRYFPVRDGAANVLKSVVDDLHASYIVTYQLPSRQVGFHSLRILPTHNLKLSFHCRSGYYYEKTIL